MEAADCIRGIVVVPDVEELVRGSVVDDEVVISSGICVVVVP